MTVRFMSRLLLAVAGLLATGCIALPGTQRSMIFPGAARENPTYGQHLPANVATLEYAGSKGERLFAYYVAPRSGETPQRVWAMFHGNASTALAWRKLVADVPDDSAGFLLVDYPGYGASEGKPSRASIVDGSEAALARLAVHLGTSEEDLGARTNALGHSLGSAAALEFASRHPVKHVVLVAPFTSLKAMADRAVTPVFSWVLHDRFDNVARLKELAERENPPTVDIFHGTADSLIPITMSERMAREFPSMVTLHPVDGATHNSVLGEARAEVLARMAADPVP